MASFKYTAMSQEGDLVNGVIDAASQLDAIARVKRIYPIVNSITEVRSKKNSFRQKKVSAKTLSLLCTRFSTILAVGLPIVQAVDMVAGQMREKHLSAMLREVARDVAMGRNLSAAFAARGESFPITFIETVRSGEESGDLNIAFDRLADYYEKAARTRQKVTSALIYPCFVLAVAMIVVGIIMTYAVPAFTKSFSSMGIDLPWVTRFIIGVSNFFTNYGLILATAVVLIILAIRLYCQTERGAAIFSKMLISLPIAGNILQLSAASQFAHTMSMMLSAGMPILRCIDTAGKGVSNYVMRRDILSSASGVEQGQNLGSCLGSSRYLPSLLVEMTAMGEATGTLETTLESVGNYYDNEVEVATGRALSVLEPVIICGLAVVVVLILFSVYIPMFSLYGGM